MTSIQADVEAICRIDAVRSMLQLLREATGHRIALIARIMDGAWTCCAVEDGAGFGLQPGDTLDLTSTY